MRDSIEELRVTEFTELEREEWGGVFQDLSIYRMPFGRYQGVLLVSLPDEYLMWFKERGFPQGRLGELMEVVYEIKMVGAEDVFEPIRAQE